MKIPYPILHRRSTLKQKEPHPNTQTQIAQTHFTKKRKNKLNKFSISNNSRRQTSASVAASNTSGAAWTLEEENRNGFAVIHFEGLEQWNESWGLEEMIEELHTGTSIVERGDEEIEAIFEF